jgi:hypothetical protein
MNKWRMATYSSCTTMYIVLLRLLQSDLNGPEVARELVLSLSLGYGERST